MQLFQAIIHADQQVLLFINSLHNSFLDTLMWTLSEKTIWYPLYAVLLFFMIRDRKKYCWITLLAIVVTILISDRGSDWIKDILVRRPRPTHDPVIGHLVHTVHGYVGGAFGFISSHASNSFAVASFTSLFFSKRWFTVIIYLWAFSIAYSRMYLGVHYPLDVLGGALLGILAGSFMYSLERWSQLHIGKFRPTQQTS